MYCNVSPGVAPAAPVFTAIATDFWMAIDLAVRTWSLAVESMTTGVSGSRGSSGVQAPAEAASFTAAAGAPVGGGSTGNSSPFCAT